MGKLGKIIKIFFIAAVIIISAANLYSQNNIENTNVNNAQITESQISLDEGSVILDSDGTSISSYTSTNNSWFFIRMVLVLILIVVAIYFVMRFFKNKNNPTVEDSDFLRKVATLNIAPGRTVEIVTLLDGKGYVLGVTENNINLLAEIGNTAEEKELISALNLTADKKQKNNKPANFTDVLEMFVGRGKTQKNKINNIYEDSERKVDDFINSNSSEV